MAEPTVFKVEFEYIQPTNIECEVPRTQKLREDNETADNDDNAATSMELASQDSTLEESNKDEDAKDFVYAPVMTVTQQEAAYTKGDLKLQKFSVTENISEPGINGAVYVTINSNPNINSDVIQGQPMRVDDDERGDDKPKTRIPMMKFRQAADKVKKDRRASLDKNESPSSRLAQKRSSIPKLQRRGSKPDTNAENTQPDDEFDKLYHEIVDNEPQEIVIKNNEVKVEDPVNLENKFEEIIHDYEDNKVQPIRVDKKHTKIPHFKRKTEQELKIPKPVVIPIKTSEKAIKEDTKPEKIESKIPTLNDVSQKTAGTKYNIPNTEDNTKISVKLPTKIPEPEIKKQTSLPERIKEIDSKPKVDFATTVKREPESKVKKDNIDIPTKPKPQRSYSEENAIDKNIGKIVDVKLKEPLAKQKETTPDAKIDPVRVISSKEFERKISENNHISLTKPKGPLLRAHSEENPKTLEINVIKEINIKEQPVLLMEADFKNNPKENYLNESNNKVETKVADTGITVNDSYDFITDQNVIITDGTNILDISEIELKPEQIITEEYTPDNVNEEDKTVTRVATNEKNNKVDVTEFNDDNEYAVGKVSRILQRINSKEFAIQNVEKDARKKEINEIPKKKSVLSKVAMFEQHEPLAKPPGHYRQIIPPKPPTKPMFKDGDFNNTDKTPIIVDEILKSTEAPKPTTNNNEIETIIVQELEKSNIEEDKPKDYTVEIVDESVKYHEVQFIKDFETEFPDIEEQNELRIVSNDVVDTPTLIVTDKLKPNPIVNVVQIMEPIKTECLEPPIQKVEETIPIYEAPIEILKYKSILTETLKPPIKKVEEKMPMHKVPTETLKYKPIAYEFKDEYIEDDAEVFSDEKDINRIPRRFKSRQESRKERPKSVAEIDLGNILKGRVHDIIIRMNSVEKVEAHKKEIDIKDRPRRKSVSMIIALFEQKSSPTLPTAISRPETNTKASKDRPTLSEEEYETRNKELINGKLYYGRIENMTYLVLNNGLEMPVIALGTALMDKQLVRNIVESAIDMGYRAIDTAYIYGNEKEVGEAIRAKIEDGTVVREDLFIISKLWSTYHRRDLVPHACKNSLTAMGLDYFDLYLIHNPMSFKEGNDPLPKIANVIQYSEFDYLDAWYGMETLVSKGLVKSVGVSNFNSVQLQRILDKSKVKPVVNQVECHPYLSQQRLDDFCSSRDICLSCYGVLGSVGTPAEMKSNLPPVFDDPLVKVMAAGLNISVAQLLIRYQIDSGHAVVVKASTAAHLWDNLQALQIGLAQPQLDALNALNKNKRTFTFMGMGDTHRNYPFKIPF